MIRTSDHSVAGGGDRGSAVVDFVLVGGLVTLLFLGVLQVAVDYHVRNVLASCAADGARYGANADVRSAAAGADRADELIRTALGPAYAHARPGPAGDVIDGAPVLTVVVRARLPVLAWFLPIGPEVTVTGHALAEAGQ